MFVLIMTILGAAVGSFLTVAVERFERGETFAQNRSYCESCKKQLRWWELVPVLSFLFLKGKCARCRASIPQFAFWFEVITASVFFVHAWHNPLGISDPFFYVTLVIVSSLLLLFYYDLRHQVFPGLYLLVSGVIVAVGVLALSLFGPPDTAVVTTGAGFGWLGSPSSPLLTHVLGGVVGVALLGALAFPSRGKWMGYGDVILAGIIGLWVGYPLVWVSVLLSFYLGAIMGVGLLLVKRVGQDHRIPFGPFLIIGAIVTHIWGNTLFHAIIKLWGG